MSWKTNRKERKCSEQVMCRTSSGSTAARQRETDLIEIGDDLIEEAQALHAHVVSVQLDVEVVEVGNGGEEHADLRVRLIIQVLWINKCQSKKVNS